MGDDLTKNYGCRWSARSWSGPRASRCRSRRRSWSWYLLVIRLVLKHLTWDARALRLGGVPQSARAELEYLEERSDDAQVRRSSKRSFRS